MNEIWLVYNYLGTDASVHDTISYAVSEKDADELIEKYKKICQEEPIINVESELLKARKSIPYNLSDEEYVQQFYEVQRKYIKELSFEERLRYICGKSPAFKKLKIEQGLLI